VSNDRVRFVYCIQDKHDGKWLPHIKRAGWTDDDLRREEFLGKDEASDVAKAYGGAEVVKVPMPCRESAYDEARALVGWADRLADVGPRLDCRDEVEQVAAAMLRRARVLRAGVDDD